MLDTIALTLDPRDFAILDPRRFSPSAEGLLKPPYLPLGARGYIQCVQNPTRADLTDGRYLPRLTLTRRVGRAGFSLKLRIEFSAPKLIFGNNFDEMGSQDFNIVVVTLRNRLASMEVRVSEEALRGAGVSAVHYGKNIPITDYSTCAIILRELAKIDLSRRLDLSRTDFRNEGHALHYHTNTTDIVFYDKIKDLLRAKISEKRAIEPDNAIQRDLFAIPSKFTKPLEVLRMEVRLGNRTKIREIFGRVGIKAEPTFAGVFEGSIAKSVLMHFWANVRRDLPLMGWSGAKTPEQILDQLVIYSAGRSRPSKLLQQVGYIGLINSVGSRAAVAALSRHCHPRSMQRLKRQMRSLKVPENDGYCALSQVDEALERFETFRLRNFQSGKAA
jgi:hypothetical protein